MDMSEEQIIFKDEEESDFICAGLCIAGIVYAVVSTSVSAATAIKKTKAGKEAAARKARRELYVALIGYNKERKRQGKKKITTEMMAMAGIVMVILVMIILYKFAFSFGVKAKN